MGQLSSRLRSVEGGHAHWCPGCQEMHVIPNRWAFDGNVTAPTFSPSVKIDGLQVVKIDGQWTGEWVRDAAGNTVPECCHYILTAGRIQFCGDCTHAMAGQTVDLPDLPNQGAVT